MILIIDDDAAVRSSLTFLLKRAGYEPEAVPGPQEALAIVRERAPRLILMDMNFTLTTSGEEGIQLLRQVKIFQPHVPVILMPAWGSISLAVEGMRAGAFDFVTKPWNNLVLLKSIRTALELGERKRAAYEKRYVGREVEVLVEEDAVMDGRCVQVGHTKEYIKVALESNEDLKNRIVKMRIENDSQIMH